MHTDKHGVPLPQGPEAGSAGEYGSQGPEAETLRENKGPEDAVLWAARRIARRDRQAQAIEKPVNSLRHQPLADIIGQNRFAFASKALMDGPAGARINKWIWFCMITRKPLLRARCIQL
ncbi:MAG: hypothetical protein WBB32_07650 [Flavobacteriales bacterium]